VDTEQAISLQRSLSTRVKCVDEPNFEPRFLCGMDAAYQGDTAFVAAAVWDLESMKVVETTAMVEPVSTKYVPGFLGFREGPLLVRIAEKIRSRPNVFLIDGQGVAHPRKFGLACHVGLALDKPTIGVAKSRLYGKLDDRTIVAPGGEVIGRTLASRNRKFYVSVGHRISLETASNLVEKCMVNGHPSPLRQAHLESIRTKRGVLD
jgi:deoxyribonuclease V